MTLPGREWNPVLVVLGVLAALTILATLRWWLGVLGIAAALLALAVVVYLDE